MTELLSFGFMQRALIACVVVSAVAPLVGAFIVQRGQSLIGDGMGHVAFAGVGFAFLVGVNPLVGAVVLTILAAVALVRLGRGGLGGDMSLALVFYGGIASGYLLSSLTQRGQSQILPLLFGSPLNLTWSQVGTVVALACIAAAAVMALYRPLVALAFDEPAARVAGLPTNGLVLALTVLVSLVVVGGMGSIGLFLISAMMVVPVAAAGRVTSSYRSMLVTAAVIGAVSAVVGLVAAFYADAPPGPAIVLVSLGVYVIASAASAVAGRSRTVAT